MLIGGGLLMAARSGNAPMGALVALGAMALVATGLLVKTATFGYEAICLLFGVSLRHNVQQPQIRQWQPLHWCQFAQPRTDLAR